MKPGRICGAGGFLGLGPWLRERKRWGSERSGGGRRERERERERGGADLDFFQRGGRKRVERRRRKILRG
jgi:hypothetical protein